MWSFIKDFFIYGFASVLGKIAAIFLMPIYTNILTKEEYGANIDYKILYDEKNLLLISTHRLQCNIFTFTYSANKSKKSGCLDNSFAIRPKKLPPIFTCALVSFLSILANVKPGTI